MRAFVDLLALEVQGRRLEQTHLQPRSRLQKLPCQHSSK